MLLRFRFSKIQIVLYTPCLEHGTPDTFSAIAACIQRFWPILAFHLAFERFGTLDLNCKRATLKLSRQGQFKLIQLALQVTLYSRPDSRDIIPVEHLVAKAFVSLASGLPDVFQGHQVVQVTVQLRLAQVHYMPDLTLTKFIALVVTGVLAFDVLL